MLLKCHLFNEKIEPNTLPKNLITLIFEYHFFLKISVLKFQGCKLASILLQYHS